MERTNYCKMHFALLNVDYKTFVEDVEGKVETVKHCTTWAVVGLSITASNIFFTPSKDCLVSFFVQWKHVKMQRISSYLV